MNNISLVPTELCTGCHACYSICTTNSIQMVYDNEGFLFPKIDTSICTNCGACVKVCPIINNRFQNIENPVSIAATANDSNVKINSSSGGIFPLLATKILYQGGIVVGAAFDKNFSVVHTIVDTERDLRKLYGSKYVQSSIGDVFKSIKKMLREGRSVLFSGTPCQAAGLKNFLGKEYANLFIIDVICAGVPSPMVFSKYISEVLRLTGYKYEDIKSISFRNKDISWESFSVVIKSHNGYIYNAEHNEDAFFRAFENNLCLRRSCHFCRFNAIPRQADITLGDLWGVQNIDIDCYDRYGTSIVLLNNKKGKKLYNSISKSLKVNKSVQLDKCVQYNPRIISSANMHQNRDSFIYDAQNTNANITTLIQKKLHTIEYSDKNVAILNFNYNDDNYGAVLLGYALTKFLQNYGFCPRHIYCNPYDGINKIKKNFINSNIISFNENYVPRTFPCETYEDLRSLNDTFEAFITGGDQVWRLWGGCNTSTIIDVYFLGFVKPTKKIIAFSPSFGKMLWDGNSKDVAHATRLLKRFSAISVREKCTLPILENLFGVSGVHVLDPVFLLTRDEWSGLSHKSLLNYEKKYCTYYILTKNTLEKNRKLIEHFAKREGIEAIDAYHEIGLYFGEETERYRSPVDWLNLIEHAEYVITDSFHGLMFSILFRKKFVFLERSEGGNARIDDASSVFSIKNFRFSSFDEKAIHCLKNVSIEYEYIDEVITKLRSVSKKYLLDSLNYKYSADELVSRERMYSEEIIDSLYGELKTIIDNISNLRLENLQMKNEIQQSKNYLGISIKENLKFFTTIISKLNSLEKTLTNK